MRDGADRMAEALDLADLAQPPGRHALDVEHAAEDALLQLDVVARVQRRVADHRDLALRQVAGLRDGERERRHAAQAVGDDERHVPERVHHGHADDPEQQRVAAVALALEVDRRGLAGTERELVAPESEREQLGDVPVRHQQVLADDEAGAAVGQRRVVGQLDPPDRGDRGLDRRPGGRLVEVGERRRRRGVAAVDDVDDGALLGQDDRLERVRLLRRDRLGAVQPLDRLGGALHLRRGRPRRLVDPLQQPRLARQALEPALRGDPVQVPPDLLRLVVGHDAGLPGSAGRRNSRSRLKKSARSAATADTSPDRHPNPRKSSQDSLRARAAPGSVGGRSDRTACSPTDSYG